MNQERLVATNTIIQIIIAFLLVCLCIGNLFIVIYPLMYLLFAMPIIGLIQIVFGIIFLVRKLPRATLLKGYFAGVIVYFLGLIIIMFSGVYTDHQDLSKYYLFPLPLLLTMTYWYYSYQVHKAVVKGK